MKDEEDPSISRTQSTSKRFKTDIKLREFGFEIHSRPKKGPVLWSLGPIVYTQDEAVELMVSASTKEK